MAENDVIRLRSSVAGKGDKPRPVSDPEAFRSNWDRIFKSKCSYADKYQATLNGAVCDVCREKWENQADKETR